MAAEERTPNTFGFFDRGGCCEDDHHTTPEELDELLTQWDHRTPRVTWKMLDALLNRGIPNHCRSKLWRVASGVDALRARHVGVYSRLRALDPAPDDLLAIDLDIRRTLATHVMFSPSTSQEATGSTMEARDGESVDGDRSVGDDPRKLETPKTLRRLLGAYSLYRSQYGYCQGMSYLMAALLLYFEDEEDTFWAFIILLSERGMEQLYDRDMVGLQRICDSIPALLPDQINRHMQRVGVTAFAYLPNWLLSLFTVSFHCWAAVMTVWDLVWVCPSSAVLPLRVAAALHTHFEGRILLCKDLDSSLQLLQHTLPVCLGHLPVLRTCLKVSDLMRPLPSHLPFLQFVRLQREKEEAGGGADKEESQGLLLRQSFALGSGVDPWAVLFRLYPTLLKRPLPTGAPATAGVAIPKHILVAAADRSWTS